MTGPAMRATLAGILVHQALSDRDAALHARWHRALDDPESEPPGPIRDHIEQHDARIRAAALRDAAAPNDHDFTEDDLRPHQPDRFWHRGGAS